MLLLEDPANHPFSLSKDLDKQLGIEPTSINFNNPPKAIKASRDAISELSNTSPMYV
jgi:hypothetical protein